MNFSEISKGILLNIFSEETEFEIGGHLASASVS